MKKLLLTLVALCAISITYAQKTVISSTAPVTPDDEVYEVVEQLPQYPGGVDAMLQFLQKTMTYPAEAERQKLVGRVVVSFIVEKDGSITNVRTVKKVHPLLDEEGIRVVKAMPKWEPGRQKGKTVRCRFNLPVVFRLK